jgi:hypothetical protein
MEKMEGCAAPKAPRTHRRRPQASLLAFKESLRRWWDLDQALADEGRTGRREAPKGWMRTTAPASGV